MKLDEIQKKFNDGTIDKPNYIKEMYGVHNELFNYSEWIKRTDVTKIEITESGIQIRTKYENANYDHEGPSFVCYPGDERVAPIEIMNFAKYEPEEYNMVCRLINDGDTVFDIGGNIGFYSIHLSCQYPNSKFFTFEPIPKTYACLKENVENNNLKNINIYNWGLSNKNDELDFFYYPEGSGNASLSNLSERDTVVTVKAKIKKLDEEWDSFNVKNVDFIKCDVEGAELFAFEGGKTVISDNKPIVFTEILRKWSAKFGYHPNDILKFFSELGYQCFYSKEDHLFEITEVTESTVETNFFFLHSDKHSDLIKKYNH